MCAAAGLVPPQHSSGEDAEAGAPEADPQQTHHGLAETQLPFQTPKPVQRERPAAQLHCEAKRAPPLSASNHGCTVGCISRLESDTKRCPPSLWVSPPCQMESRRRLTGLEASHGISPYCLPVINTFVTPVPPPTKRRELGLKVTPSSAHRGRRLRLSTLGAAHEVLSSYISCLLRVSKM